MILLTERVHTAFHRPSERIYRVVQGTVWTLIVISVLLFAVDMGVGPEAAVAPLLHTADRVLLAFFLVEIVLRVLSFRPPALDVLHMTPLARLRTHVLGRLAFCLRPLILVDLLTVAALVPALRGLRAVRLLRLARGASVFRYAHPLQGLERAFRDNALLFGFAFTAFGVTVLIGGTTLFLIEQGENSDVNTLGDGIWWAVVTLTTVGFGDITPATTMGRVAGGVLMVAGMFTLALFAGIVGHSLLHAVLSIREEQFRMSTFVNHIVVCGYDPGARMLLEALLEEHAGESGSPLVLFAPGDRPPGLPTAFMWVSGDPTKESELDKVRLSHAAAVILVGARSVPPQLADATTILTAFTIRAWEKRTADSMRRRRPLYLVAEILDAENVAHALTAGADEVVETTRVGFALLAHAVAMPGTAAILSRVVSVGANSMYVGLLPDDWDESVSFGEASRRIKESTGALVVGIRDPDAHTDQLNPPDDRLVHRPLQLIYLAPSACLPEIHEAIG